MTRSGLEMNGLPRPRRIFSLNLTNRTEQKLIGPMPGRRLGRPKNRAPHLGHPARGRREFHAEG
jgi:hypothetical protein